MRRIAALAVLQFLLGCGSSADFSKSPEDVTLSLELAAADTTYASCGEPVDVTARVIGASSGAPVGGVALTFQVTDGEGAVATTAGTTLADGTFGTRWTLGAQPNRLQTLSVLAAASTLVPQPVSASRSLTTRTRLLFVKDVLQSHDLYTATPDGGHRAPLATGVRALTPDWSPDGTRIVYYSIAATPTQVWRMNADGTGAVKLSNGSSDDRDPRWLPDGRIVYASCRPALSCSIWLMDAEGTHPVQLTTGPNDYYPSPSPDGRRIVFVTYGSNGGDVYAIDVDGSNLQRLTNEVSWKGWPAWSPDGTRIMFIREDGVGRALYEINADGSGMHQVRPDASDVAWSPDGRQIAFSNHNSTRLFVANADGTGAVQISTDSAWTQWSTPSWSRCVP